jgi:hypothetical protein
VTPAEAVRTRLLSLSVVTSIVGQRVRTMRLAQNETFPAVRVQEISTVEPMQLRGSVGLLTSRVQVDSYAEETSGVDAYAQARDLDAAVHGDGAGSGLCGFSGTVGSMTVHAILPMSRVPMSEVEEPRRFLRIMREYEVHYTS